MMRRVTTRVGAIPRLRRSVLTLLALLACSDAAGPRSAARVHLTVEGPPAGIPSVLVTGPDFSRSVSGSGTIALPRPGRYTITAAAVQSYGIEYTPIPDAQFIDVARGRNTSANVRYAVSFTTLQNDVPIVTGAPAAAAAGGTFRYYRVTVPAGALQLTVATSGGAGRHPDLYVRHGTQPTTGNFACRSSNSWAPGICAVTAPAAGEWFILLHDYEEYSGVDLRASYVEGATLAVHVSGLPVSADAGITVSGPNAFQVTVQRTDVLAALRPGRYVIMAGPVVHDGISYTPTPGSQYVVLAGGGATTAGVAYVPADGAVNLDISALYITQSTQTLTGAVPLIAGREGLLRVFVRASTVNDAAPAVRVRFYSADALIDTRTIPAPSESVPTSVADATLLSSWNLRLDGALIRPGLSVLADVDPAGDVAETDETDNVFPHTGTPLRLDVRTAPIHQARLVPVLQSPNGLIGDVHDGNVAGYITLAQAIYPLPGGTAVDMRAPYAFSGVLSTAYDSTWSRLLSEIRLLRMLDGSARHYVGVFKPGYTVGGTGLGFIGYPAAVIVDWPSWRGYIVAHEWGHNFGRLHVDCGYHTPNIDPAYPYSGGRTGVHGWDPRTNTLRLPSAHYDVMSYCHPSWTSDYTYTAIVSSRGVHTASATGSPSHAVAPRPALLVWGRIGPHGAVLEPAFEVVTAPVLPDAPGPFVLQAADATGAALLQLSFAGEEMDHLGGVRHFAFAIPLDLLGGQPPRTLRLRANGREAVQQATTAIPRDDEFRVSREPGNRVRLRWNAARHAIVIVRDPLTGEILSFARGGDVQVVTGSRALDVHVPYGRPGASRRLMVHVR